MATVPPDDAGSVPDSGNGGAVGLSGAAGDDGAGCVATSPGFVGVGAAHAASMNSRAAIRADARRMAFAPEVAMTPGVRDSPFYPRAGRRSPCRDVGTSVPRLLGTLLVGESVPSKPGTYNGISGLAGPCIPQGHAAVEHRLVRRVVVTIRDEVTDALELERLLWSGLRCPRFDVTGDDAARFRVEVILVRLPAVFFIVRIGDGEQAVVQAHFGSC